MDFSLPQTLLPGYRFSPTDQELVQFYLYPKVTNPLFITSGPVRDCDIYAYQPLQIWNAFHRIQGEDVFFFTNLKKKSPTSHVTRKIAGGPATWHREDTDRAIGVAIDEHCSVTGIRKCFSYQSSQPGQHGCGWTMYEYSLPSLSQVIVLCQLRRKDDKKSHTQTTKKRRRQADGVDDATNTISQKARVGEGYHQQQITGFQAAAETESEIVYNGVRFDNLESFSHQLFEDFDNDQMAVSSVASTINVAAPTASTSSCAENLQPNKVVCIDNDEEPSATEEDDDYHRELLRLLGLDDGSDLAGGVPSIQSPPEADEVRSTPKGSTPVESLATDADGYHRELLPLLDLDGGSDLAGGVPSIQSPPEADEVRSTPKGSTTVESLATDADGYHQELLPLLDLDGGSDLAGGVPYIQSPPEADEVRSTPKGSTTVESLATDADGYHRELLPLLDLDGGSDLAGGVPSIQSPPEADEVRSTPKGSTPVESLATDADGYHRELLPLLDLDCGSDLAGGVPSIQSPPEADEVRSTPKGSTAVESLATDADGYHLDAQVSGSSLSSGWRGSLSQQLPQANPTCLVQENEVEMIYNPFRMESPYEGSLL